MNEPSWTDVVSVISSVVIGGSIVFIAFRQWWTARSRLIFDLFEKRFAIYNETHYILVDLTTAGEVPSKRLLAFYRHTREAYFLFDEKIDFLLRSIHTKAERMNYINRVSEDPTNIIPDDKAEEFAQEHHALLMWCVDTYRALPDRFAPYLRPYQPMLSPKIRRRFKRS